MKYELCIIGGAGHVGLPLGVAFAKGRVKTVLFDLNTDWLEKIQSGKFPFKEKNGDEELKKVIQNKSLLTSDKPDVISSSKYVLLVIGTPVDEYLNPNFNSLIKVLDRYQSYFKKGQTLILRSTVYPGTSERVQNYFKERNMDIKVAFCPERIVQGQALEELANFPQIISAFDKDVTAKIKILFKKITPKVIVAGSPVEAELAKLFCNAWRYIKFAVANQFFMIADQHNLDYKAIHQAMLQDYPRMKDLPSPGLAAGPCLLKDTMQLAAFNNNNFFLGHSAMLINEGLPNYLIQKLKHKKTTSGFSKESGQPFVGIADSSFVGKNMASMAEHIQSHDVKSKTVGILGMAFKAESDDPRDSLSYKLRKIAQIEAKKVLCHDVYIKDPSFVDLDKLISESDIIILAAPHKEYKKINPTRYPKKRFIDIWGFWS